MTITSIEPRSPERPGWPRRAVGRVLREHFEARGDLPTAQHVADRAGMDISRLFACMFHETDVFTAYEAVMVSDTLGVNGTFLPYLADQIAADEAAAASAKPCPVPWCDQGGQHRYDYSRICRHETGQGTGFEIGAEVYQNDDGEMTAPVIEIGASGSLELGSADEVQRFISAVQAAAALAFPPSTS